MQSIKSKIVTRGWHTGKRTHQSSDIGAYLDDAGLDETTGLLRGRFNIRSTNEDRDSLASVLCISVSSSGSSLCSVGVSTIRLWSPADLVVMRADDDAAVADRVRNNDVNFFFFI